MAAAMVCAESAIAGLGIVWLVVSRLRVDDRYEAASGFCVAGLGLVAGWLSLGMGW